MGGAKHHINIRILHCGSNAQHKGDTKDDALQDLYVHVVFGSPALPSRLLWVSSSQIQGPT